ncbi:MAG: AAA family ATPase [Gammaproteobacteria bacterium]|nr:AAA family ATPase [Gammaproteobacteria bacterium]
MLPISYQPFFNLRNAGCRYVDKIPLVREVIHTEVLFFLSRPVV